MKLIKTLLLVAIGVVLVTFCLANNAVLEVSLAPLLYSVKMPVFLLVLGFMAVGVLWGGFLASCKIRKLRGELKKSHQREIALENEVKSLRMERESRKSLIKT